MGICSRVALSLMLLYRFRLQGKCILARCKKWGLGADGDSLLGGGLSICYVATVRPELPGLM